jgi:hypothetical protein
VKEQLLILLGYLGRVQGWGRDRIPRISKFHEEWKLSPGRVELPEEGGVRKFLVETEEKSFLGRGKFHEESC